MSKPAIIICVRCEDSEPIVGSEIKLCSDCQQSIWFSLTSKEIVKKYDEVILKCIQCAKGVLRDENTKLEPLSKEQVAEFKEWLKTRGKNGI